MTEDQPPAVYPVLRGAQDRRLEETEGPAEAPLSRTFLLVIERVRAAPFVEKAFRSKRVPFGHLFQKL